MTSPVDPKIKQALRKKPSERTPEVRELQLLGPAGSFYFSFVFPLRKSALQQAFCSVPGSWWLRAAHDQAGAHKLLLCRVWLFAYFCFPKLDLSRPAVF